MSYHQHQEELDQVNGRYRVLVGSTLNCGPSWIQHIWTRAAQRLIDTLTGPLPIFYVGRTEYINGPERVL